MVPPPLPVAFAALFRAAEHSPVASDSEAASGTGAVWSATTMCCVCVDSLPLPSLKCQVTTEVPCVVRVSESLVVPVMVPPQLSVGVDEEATDLEHPPVAAGRQAPYGTGAVWSDTTMR